MDRTRTPKFCLVGLTLGGDAHSSEVQRVLCFGPEKLTAQNKVREMTQKGIQTVGKSLRNFRCYEEDKWKVNKSQVYKWLIHAGNRFQPICGMSVKWGTRQLSFPPSSSNRTYGFVFRWGTCPFKQRSQTEMHLKVGRWLRWVRTSGARTLGGTSQTKEIKPLRSFYFFFPLPNTQGSKARLQAMGLWHLL